MRYQYNHFVSLNIHSSVCISFSIASEKPREICSSQVTNCTSGQIFDIIHDYIVTVRAKTAAWVAYSDPYMFATEDISK